MKHLIVILAAAAFVVGCDKSESGKSATASQTGGVEVTAPTEAPTEGAFSIEELKVSGSQTVYQLEEVPKPETVQGALAEALYAQPNFADGGPRKLSGLVTYDVRKSEEGYDVMLIGGLGSPSAKFDAGVNYTSKQERWKGKEVGEIVDAAVDDFAKRIAAQAEVLGADVPGLVKLLKEGEKPTGAKLLAIQELRERDAKEHVDAIRPYLGADHPSELRVAASASLVIMGDEESNDQIVKVAQDLSRDRDPQFVPMLQILADIGGTEVETYLSAIAEGHSAPAVRAVAKEALERARGNKEKAQ